MLEIEGLGAGYGTIQVLWDVEMTVGDGEIVALIGANGAGKTTLLRAVTGELHPLSGTVRWNGEDITGLPPERVVGLGIAHAPEGRRLFAGLSVRENFLIGAYVRKGDPDIDADIQRMVELFPRLEGRMDQVAGRLSGGEQQMCAIARALMSRPKLLLVDELSLGLAPNLVEHLLRSLEQIARDGTAILLVEQDVDAALHAAERGYVLEVGRIVASGPAEEIRGDPKIREAYLGVA